MRIINPVKHWPKFWRFLLATAGFVLAVILLTVPLRLPQPDPVDRYFRVEASQFAYSPGVLRVNPGDRVTIDLMATDVVHGIYIDDYALSTSADPGQTARLTFTANRAGLFRFRCLVPCGQLHPFMLGKLQVGPNLFFLRAGLLSLVGLLLMVIWKKPLHSDTN